MAVHSRSATTDIVASGLATPNLRFQPDVCKNERASSRSATTDINPECVFTLIVYNIGCTEKDKRK